MKFHGLNTAALVALAFLAGCGGGGAVPGSSTLVAAHNPAQGAQSVNLTINIPGRSAKSALRHPNYVGIGTQSAVITIVPGSGVTPPNPATTTVNCTSVCSATIAVFPGNNTFTVKLYDGTLGSGALISTGMASQTIVAGANTVNLTFNGVPVAVMVTDPGTFTSGTPGTATLTVNGLDADGNTIVAPGTYTQNITVSSASSFVTLSPLTVSAPGQTVTATYSGTAVLCDTNVAISAAIGTGIPGPGGFVPVLTGTPCGVSPTPSSLTLTVAPGPSHTGSVTVTDPGFAGTITTNGVNSTCLLLGNASLTPSSGTGPSAAFTVTGLVATVGTPCTIQFTDGTTNTTLTVFVN